MPEFLGSLTPMQWIAIAILGLLALRNRDVFAAVLKRGKALTTTVSSTDPTAEQAFQAVNLLLAHFESTGCETGLAAARQAGKCLFDKPGEHATHEG